ncbi:phosphoethanolamine--lipid A transferase [Aeromonas simiae]|uniref:phosphoethanolamine transferase n=1 Tax=Aeromonas simiae TaxID=218936 RepID=UPI00266C0595|nr:phosphoethanolamine--lipid A transferase [Aeromonas simiae]MDO2947342.1 phosphoethanolamine--lipid A transferase [Aeromonas simiae]MDO2954702.1 phosphoethanolamine--lipid A transferase [Aeromonas simiae]
MPFRLPMLRLHLLLVLYFALILNWPVLLHLTTILEGLEHVKVGFVVSIPLLLIAALNLVFLPFSLRFVQKPFFVMMLLTGSLASYGMLKYGVVFDADMVRNVVETNPAEAESYLSLSSFGWFLITGILPVLLLLLTRIEYPRWWKGSSQRLGAMAVSLLLLGAIAGLYYQDYASVGRNNKVLTHQLVPSSYVHAGWRIFRDRYLRTPEPYREIGTDARQVASAHGDKPTLLFLVVGETARAQNYALNGYGRDTNPFTRTEKVISFAKVQSCGTATAVSVPCMFSNLTRAGYDDEKAHNQDGVLDVLARAGVSVLWKENDGGCKGVCDRVPTITMSPKEYPTLCRGDVCLDEVLLQGLDREIESMRGNRVVAFHLMGSHGPTYFKRYPDEQRAFTPDCPRSDIENCSQEALVNTYDNTIRYTDWLLSQMIARLKGLESKYRVGLIYLSDHGESLGEKGLYLHGTPYALAPQEQTHVPMLMWLSPELSRSKGIDEGCLSQAASEGEYSQDNLFHSLLGVMDVATSAYQPRLDMFKPCRAS